LLFDEATSALDSIVEKEITDTVYDIAWQWGDLITVLVAHRLSTVMRADRIYVMENWYIIESWSHDTLLDFKWLYYALWRQQVGERE
jgi:ATP-binding cassette subfamily B protein